MRRISLVSLCLVLAVGLAAQAKPPARAKIKLMVQVGGCCHDFTNLPPILKHVLEKTGDFDVTITDDRSKLASPAVDAYDEVLFYTQGGELTPEQEKGITQFVSNGKGIAGIHCASDSFPKSDAWWPLIGGRFTGHRHMEFTVKIEDTDHPITCWLNDFQINDEDYDHNLCPDAKLHILARRPKDGQPAAWVQDYGKGRVFFTGLGHDEVAWKNPAFQELVVRGLYWAAGRAPKSPEGEQTK